MHTVIIIPARYASTRYPGKPLAMLSLPDGSQKSLIELTWDAALQVSGIEAVYVATDDDQIRNAAEAFGANIIMTSNTCENGTERCAEAVSNMGIKAYIVVNLQGDAPLTPPWFIEALVKEMQRDFQVHGPKAIDRDETDGLSLSFYNWRFNLRASNTEPLLRLNIEGRGSASLVQEKLAEIKALL